LRVDQAIHAQSKRLVQGSETTTLLDAERRQNAACLDRGENRAQEAVSSSIAEAMPNRSSAARNQQPSWASQLLANISRAFRSSSRFISSYAFKDFTFESRQRPYAYVVIQ
jgi:hypothetical protein